jgi:hypothetical protein
MLRPTKLPKPARRAPKAPVHPDRRYYVSVKPEGVTLKTSGVTPNDIVRVLAKPAFALYRDGMTVADFCQMIGDNRRAKQMLHAAAQHGLIGIVDGTPPKPEGQGDDA